MQPFPTRRFVKAFSGPGLGEGLGGSVDEIRGCWDVFGRFGEVCIWRFSGGIGNMFGSTLGCWGNLCWRFSGHAFDVLLLLLGVVEWRRDTLIYIIYIYTRIHI